MLGPRGLCFRFSATAQGQPRTAKQQRKSGTDDAQYGSTGISQSPTLSACRCTRWAARIRATRTATWSRCIWRLRRIRRVGRILWIVRVLRLLGVLRIVWLLGILWIYRVRTVRVLRVITWEHWNRDDDKPVGTGLVF